MTRLTFLGTGGGRFCTIHQKRATGGLYVHDPGLGMHIDPGPGALTRAHTAGIDPTGTNAILVSHAHTDHASDTAVLVKAMTRGGLERRGALLASRSVLEGAAGYGPAIDPHHLALPERVELMEPGFETLVSDQASVKATRAEHSDPTTIGFQFVLSNAVLSTITDTAAFSGLVDEHRGSDILVIEAARPHDDPLPHHLAAHETAQIIETLRPRLAILDKFGMKMIAHGPEKTASRITRETGVPTIAATDGMEVFIDDEIQVRHHKQPAPPQGAPPAPVRESMPESS